MYTKIDRPSVVTFLSTFMLFCIDLACRLVCVINRKSGSDSETLE